MATVLNTKTVLITGASSGIGFELTRLFAKEGYQLIMVSKNADKLQAASKRIKAEFNQCITHTIACDLSVPGNAEKVKKEVDTLGLTVQVLVNDAGFGEHGFFTETSLKKELEIINLNVASLVHLTKLFLPDMVAKGEGKILQLGSVVSFMPAPLMAVYAASKAFVLSFSEALQNELQATGVTVTVLCPPATDTNFFKVANAENTKAAQGNLADPAVVAQSGYTALMNGDKKALPTLAAKMQAYSSNIIPDATLADNMRKQMEEN